MTTTCRAPNPLPSLEELQEKLEYDPDSGKFSWRHGVTLQGRAKPGQQAGKVLPNGYRQIIWRQKGFYAHRVAWLFITGDDPGLLTVDHINRQPDDNRACNLRLATQSMQNLNQGNRSDNTSGIRGVHFCKTQQVWIARAWADGKLIWTGLAKTKQEAAHKRSAFLEAHG